LLELLGPQQICRRPGPWKLAKSRLTPARGPLRIRTVRIRLLRFLALVGGAGIALALIAGLLRGLRPNRDATGDEQQGPEQGNVHTLHRFHLEVIPSPEAADSSTGRIRIEGVGRQMAFRYASRVFLGGMGE